MNACSDRELSTDNLYRPQHAANIACGDPNADSNRQLTPANCVWLIFGGIFWALIVISRFLPVEETL
jgi:hypothetical protein